MAKEFKYEPYKALVRTIVIQELKDCGWVELICIPIENPEKLKPEDIQEALEEIHKLFYNSDKVELSIQGVQLCIRNLDKSSRTFRFFGRES